ncbi:TOTE conflict system archaeo-eukaryotic primase domain-containing protein [Arthrobacter ginsengisoli]|uniref:TOTE conflict system archaeo-eukaryotic primase domain-containing protein n=1 Tax=Arthrobacter ginsengisoli TaxID=1356565 RepID=UPI0035B56F58
MRWRKLGCSLSGIAAALEVSQSGRGAHAWIFFSTAIPASAGRQLGTGLIHEAMALRGSMSLHVYLSTRPRIPDRVNL